MSAKTRINRPTTSTPRNLKLGRMIHQSTNYGWVLLKDGTQRFLQLARGRTYRKASVKE